VRSNVANLIIYDFHLLCQSTMPHAHTNFLPSTFNKYTLQPRNSITNSKLSRHSTYFRHDFSISKLKSELIQLPTALFLRGVFLSSQFSPVIGPNPQPIPTFFFQNHKSTYESFTYRDSYDKKQSRYIPYFNDKPRFQVSSRIHATFKFQMMTRQVSDILKYMKTRSI
jgi:hypothetical protein